MIQLHQKLDIGLLRENAEQIEVQFTDEYWQDNSSVGPVPDDVVDYDTDDSLTVAGKMLRSHHIHDDFELKAVEGEIQITGSYSLISLEIEPGATVAFIIISGDKMYYADVFTSNAELFKINYI